MISPLPLRFFDLLALSLTTGPNYSGQPVSCWHTDDELSAGIVIELESGRFANLALRRRVDRTLASFYSEVDYATEGDAGDALFAAMKPGKPPEPLSPGVRRRPSISDTTGRTPLGNFAILSGESHGPAQVAVEAAYLAMPSPGPNFVSDFQTQNFDSRLWELYLIAALREQGITVTQPHESPDFLIERQGHRCHIEAVTTHLPGEKLQGNQSPVHAPTDKRERILGQAAVRFAKTLRSKLQRSYHLLPHVIGQPFAIAMADFHAPSTMTWSREALPSYLYGLYAHAATSEEGRRAVGEKVDVLLGEQQIPAGLFRDAQYADLSAVVFSNAATLGKFNRMGYLAGVQPTKLRMARQGVLFDRTPGALEPLNFAFDILDERYAALWPWGEAWSQELEVYHNPLARHPIPFDLIPGATHWFEQNGEIVCSTMWENTVLSSVTHLIEVDPDDQEQAERYERFIRALSSR